MVAARRIPECGGLTPNVERISRKEKNESVRQDADYYQTPSDSGLIIGVVIAFNGASATGANSHTT